VGAGAVARAHLATLLTIPDVQVVGIADPVTESANALAAQAKATPHANYRELVGKVDAAWICTPTFLHPEQTIAFAEAGAHVFCEKPIALGLADADRMIAAAQKARVQLMIGMVIRYYPETMLIKKWVESGELGQPIYVFGRRLFSRAIALSVDWRRDVARSGGMTLESGIHEVDTVRWLGGEVETVAGRVIYGDPDHPEFDTDFRSLFQLRSGATGAVDVSVHVAERDWSWGVVGTQGTATSPRRAEVRLSHPGGTVLQVHQVETVVDPLTGINRSMLAENRAFVEAIRDGKPVPIPGEEGRRNLEVILSVIEASRKGQVLRI
jgi:predicted dehydrogenase